jgi:parallel beta-helix repeat protein
VALAAMSLICAPASATPAAGAQNGPVTFFVAPNGRDNWSGRLAEPEATGADGPFATLRRARDAVRKLKGQGSGQPGMAVRVLVRGGRYFLDEPLVLGPEDGGSSEFPVEYAAYPGEKPILSGGREITNWQPYQGKVLRASVAEAKGQKWKFRQLFRKGQCQVRARTPNFDPRNPVYGGWLFMEGPAEPGSTLAFKYRAGSLGRHWSKPQEAEVNVFPGANWHNDIIPIASVDETNRIIRLARHTRRGVDAWPGLRPEPSQQPLASWWTMASPYTAGNRFLVENVLEELDQPGEWFWDSEEATLYFWPPDDDARETEVVLPRLNRLLDLRGVAHVTISGLTFMETNGGDNQLPPGGDGYGPMFPLAGLAYCGDAVHLQDAAYCVIQENRFVNVGGNGILLEGHTYRNTIRRNVISRCGANGICLLGNVGKHPLDNLVSDNWIRRVGLLDKYSSGIFLGVSRGNLIQHNLIEDVPHQAINLGNNGFGRNFVEYNEIHRPAQELSETAAINSWMEYSGSLATTAPRSGHVIRYNLITDMRGSSGQEAELASGTIMAIAIFLDNDTSNTLVWGNVIIRCPVGVSLHGGHGNQVENNIFANCSVAVWHCPYDHPALWRGQYVARNILYFTQPEAPAARQSVPFYLDGWSEKEIALQDENLLFNTHGGEYPVCSDYRGEAPWRRQRSFREWQALGFDAHSVIADPLFADAGHDDYRLRPGSPALQLGFQAIEFSRLGPRVGPPDRTETPR